MTTAQPTFPASLEQLVEARIGARRRLSRRTRRALRNYLRKEAS